MLLTRCKICKRIIWFWQKKDIFGKYHYGCDIDNFFISGSQYNIPNLSEQWEKRKKYLY